MCKYCEQKRCEEDACNIKKIEKFNFEKDGVSVNTYITEPTPISLLKKKSDYLAKMHIHYSCNYNTVSIDIPIRYCPFCGEDLQREK